MTARRVTAMMGAIVCGLVGWALVFPAQAY